MNIYRYLLAAFAAFFVSCTPALADLADAVGDLQSDSSWLDAINVLILSVGSYDWALWVLLVIVVVHFAAVIWVNVTDTPDDNTRYGKLYKNVLEPLAGLLVGFKAKQKSFGDLYKDEAKAPSVGEGEQELKQSEDKK